MGLARKPRQMQQRSKFLSGQFFVNLPNLPREAIRSGTSIADVARYPRVAFQGRSDGFDLSLCILGRSIGHVAPKKDVSIKARFYTMYRICCRQRRDRHRKRTCTNFGLPQQVFAPQMGALASTSPKFRFGDARWIFATVLSKVQASLAHQAKPQDKFTFPTHKTAFSGFMFTD